MIFFFSGILRQVQDEYQINDSQAGALQVIQALFKTSLNGRL